jgi:hypothetical protein
MRIADETRALFKSALNRASKPTGRDYISVISYIDASLGIGGLRMILIYRDTGSMWLTC